MARSSLPAELLLARAIAAEQSGDHQQAEILFFAACDREFVDLGEW